MKNVHAREGSSEFDSREPTNHGRAAFTLVEVVAVVVVMAILAGAMIVSLGDRMSRVRMSGLLDRLESLDRQSRTLAWQQKVPMLLAFDRDQHHVERSSLDNRPTNRRRIHLPKGFGIASVRVSTNASLANPIRLTISPQGQSPTYAIEVSSGKKDSEWLVFGGVTGQAVRGYNETEVTELFRQLR